MKGRLQLLSSFYRYVAVFLLNLLLVLVAMNAAAWIVLPFVEPAPGPLSYGMETLQKVYPDRAPDSIRQMLSETWSRKYIYAPFVQFRESRVEGSFVNVLPGGFRASGGREPWPPVEEHSIFVFGGSTTFGYGVADGETIPASLRRHLGDSSDHLVTVYNFGRGNYYSTQERILFEGMLQAGLKPSIAVFVDGLNEFGFPSDEPKFTRRLAHQMSATQIQRLREFLVKLPLPVLLKTLAPKLFHKVQATKLHETDREGPLRVVERWIANRRLIRAVAREFDVAAIHVWQPAASYNYDGAGDPFHSAASDDENPVSLGYGYLAQRLAEEPSLGGDFLWLADMHSEVAGPLYVDRVHYSPGFCDAIGARIAAAIGSSAWARERGFTGPKSSRSKKSGQ